VCLLTIQSSAALHRIGKYSVKGEIFDPLNLQDKFDLNWMREAEIKHGRTCMLAVVGFVANDAGLKFPGPAFEGISSFEAHDAMCMRRSSCRSSTATVSAPPARKHRARSRKSVHAHTDDAHTHQPASFLPASLWGGRKVRDVLTLCFGGRDRLMYLRRGGL
jgi:hypothetical protein